MDDRELFLRPLSGQGRDSWELAIVGPRKESATAVLVVDCLVDKEGVRVFKPTDVTAVAQLPANVVRPIADAVFENNKLGEDAVEVAEGE